MPEGIIATIGWFALGWLVGIGVNRLIYQVPRDLPIHKTPVCSHCGVSINPIRLLPSRLCATCHEPLGYDRIEWPLAVLFGAFALKLGVQGALVDRSLFATILLVIAMIDLRSRYVYLYVVLFGLGAS